MYLIKNKIICFLISVFFVSSLAGQSGSSDATGKLHLAINSSTLSLSKLSNEIENKGESSDAYKDLSDKMDRLNSLYFRCINILNQTGSKTVSSSYTSEIKNYQSLFELALTLDNIDSVDDIVDFINDDLNLKYDGSLASNDISEVGMVTISVHVFDSTGTKELSGYDVSVRPARSADPTLVINLNPTNNATQLIAPGKKMVTITKDGKSEILPFTKPEHAQQPLIERIVNYFLDRGENPCSVADGVVVMELMKAFTLNSSSSIKS